MTIRDSIIQLARAEVANHTPYIWGGQTLGEAVDCSGLVVAILRKLNLVAPNWDDTAEGMHHRCHCKSLRDIEEADLIFYGRPDPHPDTKGFLVTHVAIYSGHTINGQLSVIHARRGDSSCTSTIIAKMKHAQVEESTLWAHTGFLGAGDVSSLFRK